MKLSARWNPKFSLNTLIRVGASLAIVTARRKILEMLRDADALARFKAVIRDGTAYAVHPIDRVAPVADVAAFLKELEAA